MLPNSIFSTNVCASQCTVMYYVKMYKLYLNGMAAGSITRKKLPMFVVGKAKPPRCFKSVKSIPCCYWAQPKCWMLSELLEE